MSRLPMSRLHAFWRGDVALASSATPGEVRTAQVILEVEGRHAIAFASVCFPRHRITSTGHINLVHRDHGVHKVAELIDWSPPEEGVVNLVPRIAKRDHHAEHSWKPTEEQLQQIANLINGVAKRPPIVVVTADGLKRA